MNPCNFFPRISWFLIIWIVLLWNAEPGDSNFALTEIITISLHYPSTSHKVFTRFIASGICWLYHVTPGFALFNRFTRGYKYFTPAEWVSCRTIAWLSWNIFLSLSYKLHSFLCSNEFQIIKFALLTRLLKKEISKCTSLERTHRRFASSSFKAETFTRCMHYPTSHKVFTRFIASGICWSYHVTPGLTLFNRFTRGYKYFTPAE
jgi:hypothetical protein